jgi:ECF transporter S component (folate family)
MFKASAKAITTPQHIATVAMMIALFVVLYAVKIPLAVVSRISFTFIPVAVSAYLMGPIAAMIVAGCGDILGCMLFPAGEYFPGFTLSAILSGLIYGIFLYRCRPERIRLAVILSKLITVCLINIVLNTLWLSIMYEKAFFVYLTTRAVKNIIMFPFQVIITIVVTDVLNRTGITKKYFR